MEQYNSIQQILKKENGHDRKPIYPSTVIQAVFDAKTGASLEAILAQFNSIYVQYQGTPQATRNIIPVEMRRAGLMITYMNMDSETITEKASSAVQKDNDHWGLDVNWSRVDELSLSGDIAVSANGTWIINGVDTKIPARGSKGDAGLTPWLKTIDNKLHYSYDNTTWEPCSDYLAGYFRFNATSSDSQAGTIGKIQISKDNKTWQDLSPEFRNYLRIKGYVSSASALPKNQVVGTIYGVNEGTNTYSLHVWDGSSWVNNGIFTSIAAGVVQETGDSETEVMSQKAVSEKFKELDSVSTTVYGHSYTNTITNANGLGTYRCDCNVKSGDVMFVSFESPVSDVVCNFGVYFDDGTTHFDIGKITRSGNNIKYIAEKNVIRVALYITQNVSLDYFTINVESQSLRDRVELNTGDLSLIKLGERPKATGMLFASLEMEINNGYCLVKYTKDLSSTGYIYHEKGFLAMPNDINANLEFSTGLVIVYADTQTKTIAISQQYAEVPLDAVIIEVFYSYQGDYTKCCWTSPFVKKNILHPNEYCSFSNPKYAESIKSIESAVLGHLYNITYKSVPGESLIYVLNVNASKDSTIKVWFESTSTLQCAFGVYFEDGTRHFDIARLNNNVPFNYVAENNITRVALYIDTYGNVDELSIYADVLGLTEEVKNLKNASASFEIKPLSAKIFQRVGCIGDSYTAGYIYTSNGLLNSSHKNSWPHYMEGLTNNRYDNWGKSGSTAKGWVLGAAELTKVKAVGNKCQAYVIGLMINDRTEASWNDYYTPVGSSSDIGTDADSYYAYYYKLVQEVVSVNPDAKIFCNTCPKWSDTDAYNQAVKNIVSYCKKNGQNVFLCDLASDKYANLYQNEVFVKDYINGHYTAIGYEYMAECYLHVLSDVINENVKEFQNVAYIDFD